MTTATTFTLDSEAPVAQYLAPLIALAVVALAILSGADSSTTWYIIRATGIVAYVLVTLSVIGGLLMSLRLLPAGQLRVDLFELHRFISLTSIAFGSIHVVALLFDAYIGFSPAQILVPFTSTYKPLSVGLGIISLYTLVLVFLSFWAKAHIGYRTWRTIHYLTFAVFLLVTAHGFFSGTDSGASWMVALYGASSSAVLALTITRILSARAIRSGGGALRTAS